MEALQQTFFQDEDFAEYIAEAARRFPFSDKHGRIRGTGRYLLISKCHVPWRISCFTTAEQRAEAIDSWRRNGCSSGCMLKHSSEVL